MCNQCNAICLLQYNVAKCKRDKKQNDTNSELKKVLNDCIIGLSFNINAGLIKNLFYVQNEIIREKETAN